MPKLNAFAVLLVLLAGVANAGSSGPPAALKLGQYTAIYPCQDTSGKSTSVQVTYLAKGTEKERLPELVVLKYAGKTYGLAPAETGASGGRRYVGHLGLSPGTGLEWWEYRFDSTLSIFKGEDAGSTIPFLLCTF